jgi:TonB family protein
MPAFPLLKPGKSSFYTLISARMHGEFEMFMGWAMRQMVYPLVASSKGIEGVVEAGVHIDEKGEMTVTGVKSSPHPTLSNEVIRVIDRQKWLPGTFDGIAIPMLFILPFEFTLE